MKDFQMSQMTEKPSNPRLLYAREHLPRLGITLSNSTMLRLEEAGKFPKRIRLGAHSVAWLASEIHGHIDTLAAEREAGQ
jgi:prophage regulatory protein